MHAGLPSQLISSSMQNLRRLELNGLWDKSTFVSWGYRDFVSRDGYDLGLGDFENNHGTVNHALVKLNRYYENSCDDGLLQRVLTGSRLSEETLKNILQHSQCLEELTLAYVDRIEHRHDCLVNDASDSTHFEFMLTSIVFGNLPLANVLTREREVVRFLISVSKTSESTDLDTHR